MVEGARLESVYTGNRIAGSNPAPSASIVLQIINSDLLIAILELATLALSANVREPWRALEAPISRARAS